MAVALKSKRFLPASKSRPTFLHPTDGLPGFTALDFMAPGGSAFYAPFGGVVPTNRPIGWLSTQNPASGFYGQRFYLSDGHQEAYLVHFERILVRSGQVVRPGQLVAYVGHWPGDPGRSHLHFGLHGANIQGFADGLVHGVVGIPKKPTLKQGTDGFWNVRANGKRVYRGKGKPRAEEVFANQMAKWKAGE